MNLGSAYATIDLNNVGFMSKLQQSEQAMNRLGMSGSKGLDGFEGGLTRGTPGKLTVASSCVSFGSSDCRTKIVT